MADMCKLAAEGPIAEARAINQRLMPLHSKLFVGGQSYRGEMGM